jgi:hypothetical protein
MSTLTFNFFTGPIPARRRPLLAVGIISVISILTGDAKRD